MAGIGVTANKDRAALLERLFRAGLAAISGEAAVRGALAQLGMQAPDRVLAVGKAAWNMYLGCLPELAGVPALVVTKDGHGPGFAPQGVTVIEASHPVPDARSVAAGAQVLEWLSGAAPDEHILILVSGGASALVELPVEGVDLAQLRRRTETMLANGDNIETINAARIGASRIKGGKLVSATRAAQVTVLAISDVPGDDIAVIGSGLGARGSYTGRYLCKIVASNLLARQAIAEAATRERLRVVVNANGLSAPVEKVADALAADIASGPPGLYIYGGEPTVVLPDNPGRGGRAQALALMLAGRIAGRSDVGVLVAGTDGTDGLSDAAGAIIDGQTFDLAGDAAAHLAAADSGTFLARHGAALVTGPTGTNVCDIALILLDAG